MNDISVEKFIMDIGQSALRKFLEYVGKSIFYYNNEEHKENIESIMSILGMDFSNEEKIKTLERRLKKIILSEGVMDDIIKRAKNYMNNKNYASKKISTSKNTEKVIEEILSDKNDNDIKSVIILKSMLNKENWVNGFCDELWGFLRNPICQEYSYHGDNKNKKILNLS